MISGAALLALLDRFEKGEASEDVFTAMPDETELPKLAAWIGSLPAGEREKLLKRVSRFQLAVEDFKLTMSKELLRKQKEIIAARKNKQANLAYLQTAINERNTNES